jgi:molybdopterin molybdotransferase
MKPNEALKLINNIPITLPQPNPTWLWDAAGHILARDVTATRDIPPFNRSAMDGYAVRTADLKEIPCRLKVIAVQEAGDPDKSTLASGECIKIMTGAAVPLDADAVVMIENTESDNPTEHTTILKPVQHFENIARQGEDSAIGDTILKKGQLLTGPALSVAAGMGQASLLVYPHPEIAFLQTGGELIEPGNPIAGNKIYNSNSTLLAGLIDDAAVGRPRYLGISPDDRDRLADTVRNGLTSDLLLLTGGISKGDFDYVPEILQNCGVKLHFHGLAIKPGKPLLFGVAETGCHVFGLPGNPVSAMVCFQEFVLPLLRRLAGWQNSFFPANLTATLQTPIRKKPGRTFYCPAHLQYLAPTHQLFAHSLAGHGSGDYIDAAGANGVIILPENTTSAEPGEQVTVHLWRPPTCNSLETTK